MTSPLSDGGVFAYSDFLSAGDAEVGEQARSDAVLLDDEKKQPINDSFDEQPVLSEATAEKLLDSHKSNDKENDSFDEEVSSKTDARLECSGFTSAKGDAIKIKPESLLRVRELMKKLDEEATQAEEAGPSVPAEEAPDSTNSLTKRRRVSSPRYRSPLIKTPLPNTGISHGPSKLTNPSTPILEPSPLSSRYPSKRSLGPEDSVSPGSNTSTNYDNLMLLSDLVSNIHVTRVLVKACICRIIESPCNMFCKTCAQCGSDANSIGRCMKCSDDFWVFNYRFKAEICDSSKERIICLFDNNAGEQLFGYSADDSYRLVSPDVSRWNSMLEGLQGKNFLVGLSVLRGARKSYYRVRSIERKMDHAAIARVLKNRLTRSRISTP